MKIEPKNGYVQVVIKQSNANPKSGFIVPRDGWFLLTGEEVFLEDLPLEFDDSGKKVWFIKEENIIAYVSPDSKE